MALFQFAELRFPDGLPVSVHDAIPALQALQVRALRWGGNTYYTPPSWAYTMTCVTRLVTDQLERMPPYGGDENGPRLSGMTWLRALELDYLAAREPLIMPTSLTWLKLRSF